MLKQKMIKVSTGRKVMKAAMLTEQWDKVSQKCKCDVVKLSGLGIFFPTSPPHRAKISFHFIIRIREISP